MSAGLHTCLARRRAGCMADWFFLFLAGLVAVAVPISSARSDETYICDNGRTVTVRFGELEKLASTDPCIAKYIARRTGSSIAPESSVKPAPAPALEPVVDVYVPLPVRKPVLMQAAMPANADDAAQTAMAAARQLAKQGSNDIIVDQEMAPPSRVTHGLGGPRSMPVVFRHAAHHYYSNAPLSKGPADFRIVPIINASPGEPNVFHHMR